MNNRELAYTTTDPVILDELSKDGDWYVRYRVADNPNTTPETLDYLSKDEHYYVHCAVAENPNTASETLKQMAKVETDSDVKNSIKNHPNCLEETWKYLSALELIKSLSKVST
jgi:hypothetical protein